MTKKFIAVFAITVLFMILGVKSTYSNLNVEKVHITDNIDSSYIKENTNLDFGVNNSNTKKNEANQYENKKFKLESSNKFDIEPELYEMILNYHNIDSRLGSPLEKPQVISYWEIDDSHYKIITSGYYSFGFEIWEPIDYTFFVEKNSSDEFVIKSWTGKVFESIASQRIGFKNFFFMESAFKKDNNYSVINETLSKNSRKYYLGLGNMYIIHYKKLSDTKYEVGIIDEFDHGVSHPMWESRVFLLQKNDSNQWNVVEINGGMPDDWNKIICKHKSSIYIGEKLYEQGNYMSDLRIENINRISHNRITSTVSFCEVIVNASKNNIISESKKMAEVYLEQNIDGKWVVSSMKELN